MLTQTRLNTKMPAGDNVTTGDGAVVKWHTVTAELTFPDYDSWVEVSRWVTNKSTRINPVITAGL